MLTNLWKLLVLSTLVSVKDRIITNDCVCVCVCVCQILKAVLQQQSMKVTSEDSDSVKATYQVSPPARTLVNRVGRSQTLVRSPVTLPTISVTSPVMMTSPSGASPSVMSPRLQVHDVDTSTPL